MLGIAREAAPDKEAFADTSLFVRTSSTKQCRMCVLNAADGAGVSTGVSPAMTSFSASENQQHCLHWGCCPAASSNKSVEIVVSIAQVQQPQIRHVSYKCSAAVAITNTSIDVCR